MNKLIYGISLSLILSFWAISLKGQITGIGYTLSPTAEYVQWDDKAGIADGYVVGGSFGFAFGEYLELRAKYMQGINLKSSFKDFGLTNYVDSSFAAKDVELTRWGGELKANLGKGHLLPFITLGTGIQSIQLDTFDKNEMIYVNYGAGIKLSAGDRYTFTVEAHNTNYNFAAAKSLLTDDQKTSLDVTSSDLAISTLKNNWALGASLQFYLGGRRPGKLSELDKAYFNQFSGGFRGLRIPIEPTVGQIKFHKDMNFKDTWLAGGYAGIDFNPFIGVRGFYFRATKENKLSTDLDPNLNIYGGELRMKLNAAGGISPYLMIGGGKFDASSGYVGRDTTSRTADQAFALGGAGVTLPLSNTFKIFGGARALLTTGKDLESIQNTDEIKTSWQYSAGVRFIFGKKAKPADVLSEKINEELLKQQEEYDAKLAEKEKENAQKATELKNKYKERIVKLQEDLNKAYDKEDVEKAASILKEKDEAEQVVAQIEENERTAKVTKAKKENVELETLAQNMNGLSNRSTIQLSPAEFQNIIEEIFETSHSNNPTGGQGGQLNELRQDAHFQALEQKMNDIEKLLVELKTKEEMGAEINKLKGDVAEKSSERMMMEYNARLLAEIKKLSEKIDLNKQNIDAAKSGESSEKDDAKPEDAKKQDEKPVLESVTQNNVLGVKTSGAYLTQKGNSRLSYEGMSGFMGFNIGGQFTANVGFRWHYAISGSNFEFMPETFFGFGSPSSFGLTGNVVYPFAVKKSPVTPYLGAGAGFMQIAKNGNDKVRLNYNIILGSYLQAWKGRLFVDFTARNLFKYNQIIAGYRFSF